MAEELLLFLACIQEIPSAKNLKTVLIPGSIYIDVSWVRSKVIYNDGNAGASSQILHVCRVT